MPQISLHSSLPLHQNFNDKNLGRKMCKYKQGKTAGWCAGVTEILGGGEMETWEESS